MQHLSRQRRCHCCLINTYWSWHNKTALVAVIVLDSFFSFQQPLSCGGGPWQSVDGAG
jgi:hypothetical protein